MRCKSGGCRLGAHENIACCGVDVGKQVRVVWEMIYKLGLKALSDGGFQMQQ